MYNMLYDIIFLKSSTTFYYNMWLCNSVTVTLLYDNNRYVTVCDSNIWHHTKPNPRSRNIK